MGRSRVWSSCLRHVSARGHGQAIGAVDGDGVLHAQIVARTSASQAFWPSDQ
jgi:hypothetical protein